MKKIPIAFILSLFLIFCFQTTTALSDKPTQDSKELRLQDMLMNLLSPYIDKDLHNYYYPKIFSDFSPSVAPWKIEVIETKRVNGFRGFILDITFEIEPTDGGHWVSIGKDRMTYRISYGQEVKLINHTHIATYKYPPD